MGARPAAQERFAFESLLGVIRRRGEVPKPARTGAGLSFGHAVRRPKVFADIDPKGGTGPGIDRAAQAGAEVALFVEDAVVGESPFGVGVDPASVGEDGGRVAQVPVDDERHPDHRHEPARRRDQQLELTAGRGHEIPVQE